MRTTLLMAGLGALVNLLAWLGLAWEGRNDSSERTLLNVSYDPTRELWRSLNAAFLPTYEAQTGQRWAIRQSHGGSGAQARAVIDGLPGDVVTLAMWSDTDAVRVHGLLATDWANRLPNRSLPYFSTIVFVVRQGETRIHDWPDLLRPDIQVITPNPKTSGNGKLSFLAAWGAVKRRGGTDSDAETFVRAMYRRVPVLDTGARGSTTTFAQNRIGDVHLTWENEAHLEVRESRGLLSIVYPPVSIRAEPFVAVVDSVVDRRKTRAAAEAYLSFLYTAEAQSIIARQFLRPISPEVAAQFRDRLPPMDLFPITDLARDWADANRRFFDEGAVFDRIYQEMQAP